MNRKMNKRGWLKIVEAFTAIMLILAVTLIIIEREQVADEDISQRIYEAEIEILEETVTNYKADIISGATTNIETYVGNRAPNYLNCWPEICDIEGDCDLTYPDLDDKSLYVQSAIVIDATANKELRLFCWIK